jgi:hypothetical protein
MPSLYWIEKGYKRIILRNARYSGIAKKKINLKVYNIVRVEGLAFGEVGEPYVLDAEDFDYRLKVKEAGNRWAVRVQEGIHNICYKPNPKGMGNMSSERFETGKHTICNSLKETITKIKEATKGLISVTECKGNIGENYNMHGCDQKFVYFEKLRTMEFGKLRAASPPKGKKKLTFNTIGEIESKERIRDEQLCKVYFSQHMHAYGTKGWIALEQQVNELSNEPEIHTINGEEYWFIEQYWQYTKEVRTYGDKQVTFSRDENGRYYKMKRDDKVNHAIENQVDFTLKEEPNRGINDLQEEFLFYCPEEN